MLTLKTALKYCENHLTFFFQVIFEGEIGKGNLGGIAVDDISINNHISQEDCTSKDGLWGRDGRSLCPGRILSG